MIKLTTLSKMSLANLKQRANKLDCPIDVETANKNELIQFIFDEQEIVQQAEDFDVDESDSFDFVSVQNAESSPLKSLRSQVEAAGINYTSEVAFPMRWTPNEVSQNMFTFASGHVLPVSRVGIYYLRYINRNEIAYSEITRMLEDGDYEGIANLTNHEKFHKKMYIAAMWHGLAVGFLTNYTQVDTIDLINVVVENGLGNDVEYIKHNECYSRMHINVRPLDTGHIKSFVQIENGHNGQASLNYSQGIRIGDYTRFWKYSGGRRVHLSKVGLVVDNLMGAIEEAKNIKFNERLAAMTFEGVLSAMQGDNLVDNEKFQDFCTSQRNIVTMGSAYIDGTTIVAEFANRLNERGYKTVVTTALENIFNSML